MTRPISFNAGPTYLSDNTIEIIKDIAESGFLSVSHRSPEFCDISKKAIEGLRKQMRIPADYHILYQNSSTAGWSTILENVVDQHSFHFVCGEFSKRFLQTAEKLKLNAKYYETASGKSVKWEEAAISKEVELITITHNETGSGLMWPQEIIKNIRAQFHEQLIAVDVCSSFGGMAMDWNLADIWFGSVQKALTMPSGLAYLIINNRAVEKSFALKKEIPAYRQFKAILDKMKDYQTVETPNTFLIALLAKLMENWDIDLIDKETKRKAALLYGADLNWTPHVEDAVWRSITSAHFMVDHAEQWHQAAEEANFVLGRGYGKFANGIRVCNFPSHTYEMMESLIEVLKHQKIKK